MAKQVGLAHQPEHLLVVYLFSFSLQLIGDAPIPVTGKTKADGLNPVS
jgi:hypothetical protein